ncbi:MAG: nickel pincer cofactor biosynthesis protein LarC [bacterium]
MTLAYFECNYGISGDMTLGALVDAGADWEALCEGLATLPVKGFRLEREKIKRCGITGTKVHVHIEGAHDHHRHLKDVLGILNKSKLPKRVKERATTAYHKLGEAEAKIHQAPIEKIQFHEVGALDAIVDVAGSMLALELLGVDTAEASPVAVGQGTVKSAHGVIPIPAPATAELLRGVPIRESDLQCELCTPTGAAILTTVAQRFGPMPAACYDRVGYGAGGREIPGHTNMLRVFIGNPSASDAAGKLPLETSTLLLLSTEIDDMVPEIYGHLMHRLFSLGALDVDYFAVQMKKNRPGVSVQVLGQPQDRDALITCLLKETSTFGVKCREVQRFCLARRVEEFDMPLGRVRVKLGFWGDELLKVTPEYESCRELAERHQLPIFEVYREVHRAIEQKYFTRPGAR